MVAELEPNDSLATATTFSGSSDVLSGVVANTSDLDFFKVSLTQGQRLTINPNNANSATFSPALPPSVRIMDDSSVVLGTSIDGNNLSYTAPKTGTYYVRLDSHHAFGTFTDDYGVTATVSNYSGVTEAEPNDSTATSNTATSSVQFRGDLSSTSDHDFFGVSVSAGQVLVVELAGRLASNPAVRVRAPDGTLVATDRTGRGLSVTAASSGKYTIDVAADNESGNVTGQYVGLVYALTSAVTLGENGNNFSNADTVNVVSTTSAVGDLASTSDVDILAFDLTTLSRSQFSFRDGGTKASRTLTLYNSQGQVLETPMTSVGTTVIQPGRYYLAVQAISEAGFGQYIVSISSSAFGPQRDVPLYFFDFDEQMSHLGYAWQNAYALPETIPFVTGMFDSRYDIYDVDWTLTAPSAGTEYAGQGYGDFGNIGAAGWGGGGYGDRRPRGDSVSLATATSWTTLGYGSTITMIHELGHATGLGHGRNVQDFMAYAELSEQFPVGTQFPQYGTDTRRAGSQVQNVRNYMDWATQAGAQALEVEPNDTSTAAENLAPYFREMSVEFGVGPSATASSGPYHVLSSDFNVDGKLDLLVANVLSKLVSVLLGNGDGSFQSPVNYSVGNDVWYSEPLAIGDFNGDLKPDFAVTNSGDNNVSIFLNNGNGTFAAAVNYSASTAPSAVVAGDLNGDSKLDLVISNYSPSRVSVLLGNGNGTFQAPVTYVTGSFPVAVKLADFNGDNRLDVVTANNTSSATNNVSVLLGNGNGTLQSAVHYTASSSLYSLAVADLNGDGNQDLAVSGVSGAVSLLMGQGNGTFAAASTTPLSRGIYYLTTADVNGDSLIDLISTTDQGQTLVSVNLGGGAFTRGVLYRGHNYYALTAADFNGDGRVDIATADYQDGAVDLLLGQPQDVRNDRVVIYGTMSTSTDADYSAFQATAGGTYAIDIDAAEFQSALDATLEVYDSSGTLLAKSYDAVDRETGFDSVDPYVVFVAPSAGTYRIAVKAEHGSRGAYRLKVTPGAAFDSVGPRVLATWPDGGDQVDTTRQLVFFMNDHLDPQTVSTQNITVHGATNGDRVGTVRFDPIDATIVWTGDQPLPIDTYTVTMNGGASGVRDLRGNRLDGDTDGSFAFPEISGDGTPGGDFSMSFQVTAADTTPSAIYSSTFQRQPYNRGQFTLYFSDELDFTSAVTSPFIARGAGPDDQFGTADDRIVPVDVALDKLLFMSLRRLELVTSGIPDPDRYRIEGTVRDAAGNTINVATEIVVATSVPESAISSDAAGAQVGLIGSYVNSSLRSYSAQDDWRASQTIAGTRRDYDLAFGTDEFGVRSTVGVTGGTDSDWDNFSVQWDGYITIPRDGTKVRTSSNDGSRMWIDINKDGVFDSTGAEVINSNWGRSQSLTPGPLSSALQAGRYPIRIQYENASTGNDFYLEWVTPGLPGEFDELGHGPSITDVSIQPGSTYIGPPLSKVAVTFSGTLDSSTLTTANFQLRYSANAAFFDGDDVLLAEANNAIAWDPVTRTATFDSASPLASGYYLVELEGDAGGITDPLGRLIDGEYLSSFIAGNTTPGVWQDVPSGNGLVGGDYRAAFTIGAPALVVEFASGSVSEFGGATTATVYRYNGDQSQTLTVNVSSSDTGEATVPASVQIPANQQSVTFTVSGVDDTLLDGLQAVVIMATATGFETALKTLVVADYEPLSVVIDPVALAENGATGVATVTRGNSDNSLALTVALSSSDASELSTPTTATIAAGQASATVTLTAVDDAMLDGTQTVTVTAAAAGYVSVVDTVDVTDFETLTVTMTATSVPETAGAGATTGTVTRSNVEGPYAQAVALDVVSADVPKAIFDNATITSSIAISNVIGLIQDVDVQLRITHTFDADLDVFLISPWGTRVELFTDVGGASDNFTNTILDDEASVAITSGAAPFASTYRPEGLLSVLDGKSPNGTWKLEVSDDTATDTGSLQSWTLKMSVLTLPALTFNLASTDTSEITVPATATIPAGQLTTTFSVTAVDDTLLDGTQTAQVTAASAGYTSIAGVIDVTDVESLALSVDVSTISENGGTAVGTVTRGNTDLASALVVTLSSDDTTEAAVPATVTILANQASANFPISGVDDTLLDGSHTANITASAAGYIGASTGVSVTDYETVTVTLDVGTMSENGGAATGTVARSNSDNGTALVVTLTNSDPSEATLPASVTIPANQAAVTFAATAVDDSLLDGSQTVTVTPSRAGYVAVPGSIQVTDFETLSVSLNAGVISELGGTTTGTVTRGNSDISSGLVVNLTSSDTTEAIVPATVTIGANQTSASFTITAVDDSLLDGVQTITITASKAGYVSGTRTLDVTDVENLSVNLADGAISEQGGATTATVTRSNSDTAGALVVTVSSSDTSEASAPATVTIPAGQSSATFTVAGVDDTLLDGPISTSISVAATGYQGAVASITVSDHETLTVSFDSGTLSEHGGTTSGTIVRSNSDIGVAVTVTLSNSDPSEGAAPASVTIPANQTSTTFTLTGVDDTVLDGSQVLTVTPARVGYVGVAASVTVTDFELLTVSVLPGTISEGGGVATGTVTRGNTDVGSALEVALASSDPSEAAVPATVTIPANQASVSFTVMGVDDALLDGSQSSNISAAASGYVAGGTTVTVTDHETLVVTLNVGSMSEAGGSAIGAVTRSNTDRSSAVIVSLTSGDASELLVPATVTIPANQDSVTFAVTAIDDSLLDGARTVSITPSAEGYLGVAGLIDVTDWETLTVSIDATAISEQGGQAVGSVTRGNTDRSSALVVTLTSLNTAAATVPPTVTIPANQASATFSISAVDDTLLDGIQTVSITATHGGYVSGSQSIDVTDYETVSVVLNPGSISEHGGSAIGTVARSNTDTGATLLVQLTISDSTEAAVPTTVTIPAGQSDAAFTVSAVDDLLLDGTQVVVVAASASAYVGGAANLSVTDFETLVVTVTTSPISEHGGATTGTVTRSNTDDTSALSVVLSSSDATEATVPTTVTIPASQASVSFFITAVDDTLLDGTQTVTIAPSQTGYFATSGVVDVSDHETLTLTIAPDVMGENGGNAVGTLTRDNTDISAPLVVTLASSDSTAVLVPLSVTIPANQGSVAFSVAAVDDALLDGSQTATVSATASGYVGAAKEVTVTDFETLTITLNSASISEQGGSAVATVARSNTNRSSPLVVSLSNSDATEAQIPTTVTIPANQASTTFVVNGLDDQLLDGLQQVTIGVAATGYVAGSVGLDVTDLETLSLVINATSFSELGGSATGTVTRNNTDRSAPLTVTVAVDDYSEATAPVSVTIPANSASATFTISAVDDSLLDGVQTVSISVSSAGYVGAARTLQVLDHEVLSLSFDVGSISEHGGSAVATATRSNSDVSAPLVVSLASSDATEGTAPATVTIPASQTSTTFIVSAVDDDLLDGAQSLSVTAGAVGYVAGAANLEVLDYETLTVTIDPASISEHGGTAIGTVRRSNTDNGGQLVVSLASSDTSEAVVPATLVIPAAGASATFSITGVDDSLLDGTQTVAISASHFSYIAGQAPLEVADFNHPPTISTIADRTTDEDVALSALAFTVNDAETAAGALAITASSSDQSLVPDSRLVIDGAAGQRSLRIDPAPNQYGTTTITVSVSDGVTMVSESFELVVTPRNDPPDTLALSDNTVAENASGATIGALSSTDPDVGDTHAYSVDDARFEIVGDELRLKPGQFLDYEAASQVVLLVTARDAGGLEFTRSFSIEVQDANESPTDIGVSSLTVAENSVGALIGVVTAADPDAGDSHTYSVDDARFVVVAGQLRLRPGQSLNFEVDSTVAIAITAEDSQGATWTKSFEIIVTNTNDPPQEIRLSTDSAFERIRGLTLGVLSVVDEDASQTHSLTVAPDAPVEIVGAALRLKADRYLDRQDGATFSVDVTATDNGSPSSARLQTLVLKVLENAWPWKNPVQRLDTNNDSLHLIAPIDALLVINLLNNPTEIYGPGGRLPWARPQGAPYYDVDGNEFVSPNDALQVINHLNGVSQGEEEAAEVLLAPEGANSLLPAATPNAPSNGLPFPLASAALPIGATLPGPAVLDGWLSARRMVRSMRWHRQIEDTLDEIVSDVAAQRDREEMVVTPGQG